MPNPIYISHGLLDTLFKKAANKTNQVTPGSIVRFNYGQAKHDPYPLVMVTDSNLTPIIKPNGKTIQPRIRGLNLNYFTVNEMSKMILNYCGQQGFSYRSHVKVLGPVIAKRFRYYKWSLGGVNNLQILDSKQILAIIDMMRAYDPNQADAIKKAAKDQLSKQVNPKAEEIQQAEPQPEQEPMEMPGAEMPETGISGGENE